MGFVALRVGGREEAYFHFKPVGIDTSEGSKEIIAILRDDSRQTQVHIHMHADTPYT